MSQFGMSALPPKADMCSALNHVCFGPIATKTTKSERDANAALTADDGAVIAGCTFALLT
jgi:hypothetical protein